MTWLVLPVCCAAVMSLLGAWFHLTVAAQRHLHGLACAAYAALRTAVLAEVEQGGGGVCLCGYSMCGLHNWFAQSGLCGDAGGVALNTIGCTPAEDSMRTPLLFPGAAAPAGTPGAASPHTTAVVELVHAVERAQQAENLLNVYKQKSEALQAQCSAYEQVRLLLLLL